MDIDVTFTCKCGAFIDEVISCDGPDRRFDTDEESRRQYWHTFICEGCGKDYDASIVCTLSDTELEIPNVIDLTFDTFDIIPDPEIIEEIESTKQLESFRRVSADIISLLKHPHPVTVKATLNNMLYAQAVSAVEAYLSSTFISAAVNSEQLVRRLVETDPKLANRKVSLKSIYTQMQGLQVLVATHLKELIFHDLKKVKPMYSTILGVEFGDVSWLFKAVLIRHDCVHRCGFRKDGVQHQISDEQIIELVKQCALLISSIDTQMAAREET